MAHEGRIAGRVNGEVYELVQRGVVVESIPLADAHANPRLHRAIRQNRWETLP